MILENSKGKEKSFNILFELQKDNKNYIVYQDKTSNAIYAGREKGKKLISLNDEEYDYLNELMDKIME